MPKESEKLLFLDATKEVDAANYSYCLFLLTSNEETVKDRLRELSRLFGKRLLIVLTNDYTDQNTDGNALRESFANELVRARQHRSGIFYSLTGENPTALCNKYHPYADCQDQGYIEYFKKMVSHHAQHILEDILKNRNSGNFTDKATKSVIFDILVACVMLEIPSLRRVAIISPSSAKNDELVDLINRCIAALNKNADFKEFLRPVFDQIKEGFNTDKRELRPLRKVTSVVRQEIRIEEMEKEAKVKGYSQKTTANGFTVLVLRGKISPSPSIVMRSDSLESKTEEDETAGVKSEKEIKNATYNRSLNEDPAELSLFSQLSLLRSQRKRPSSRSVPPPPPNPNDAFESSATTTKKRRNSAFRYWSKH